METIMGPSSRYSHPTSRREPQILPKAYQKSERLDLDFWDPPRLAAHVLATLSPEDQREKAADLILERQITGSFLARYTRQIEEILDGEGDCELVRAIARTVSKTFWVPLYEPRDVDRYETLGEIIKDLQLERGDPFVEGGTSSVAGSAEASWAFEKGEEEEEEGSKDDNARRAGDGDQGGEGTSRTVTDDGEGDYDLISDMLSLSDLWAKVSLAFRPGPGMFRNFTTHIFGLSRR